MKTQIINWFKKVSILSLKTMAEAALSMLTVHTFLGEVDWRAVLSATLLSGIVTFLFNITKLKTRGDT